MSEQNQVPQIPTVETNIANVSLPNPQIQVNPNFNRMLASIPVIVNKANTLLNQDMSTLDEDEIAATLTDLKEAQKTKRNIEGAKREIRKLYNNRRDEVIGFLDQSLANAHYEELATVDQETKKLKADLSSYRINTRWQELQTTFDAELRNYPLIQQYAPQLEDFNKLRVQHPDWVKGGKTAKITDKQRGFVSNELSEWNKSIQALVDNQMQLEPAYQNQLLQEFINNPKADTIYNRAGYYQQVQAADKAAAERARKEAEERRKQQEAQAKLAQQQAQAQAQQNNQPAPKPAPVKPVPQPQQTYTQPTPLRPADVKPHSEFQWLADWIFSNPRHNRVGVDPQIKVNVIGSFYSELSNPKSVVSKNTQQDPQKILAAIRYMLDL